jgi:uncharacterized membrane protein
MNLINLLYDSYVIIIFVSLLITLITYLIIRYNNNTTTNEDDKNINIPKVLFITFIISFLILILTKYGITYLNKNNFFQKGGVDPVERLTIIADDLDYDIIEN